MYANTVIIILLSVCEQNNGDSRIKGPFNILAIVLELVKF